MQDDSEVRNNRTDLERMLDYRDLYILWIAAFAARGTIGLNQISVTFKFKSDLTDLFTDRRSDLLATLDEDIPKGIIASRDSDGAPKYTLSEEVDNYLNPYFKPWRLHSTQIPTSLIISNSSASTNILKQFIYTYGILRGISYEKNIGNDQTIIVSRIYGNKKMLESISEMIFLYQILSGYKFNAFIPKIKKGKMKDFYIELGPGLTEYLFN
jgi:hypothetical protein